MGEHLLCKQGVIGSIPIRSTKGLNISLTVKQLLLFYCPTWADSCELFLNFSALTPLREIQTSELLVFRVRQDCDAVWVFEVVEMGNHIY